MAIHHILSVIIVLICKALPARGSIAWPNMALRRCFWEAVKVAGSCICSKHVFVLFSSIIIGMAACILCSIGIGRQPSGYDSNVVCCGDADAPIDIHDATIDFAEVRKS